MRKVKSIFLMLGIVCLAFVGQAQTPAQVLDKAIFKINSANGIGCDFRISSSSASASGNLTMSGKNFKITTPKFTSWYDGRNMWTANSDTKEITLVIPTQQELRESNPLEYMRGYKSQFNVYFSKRKDTSRYLVLLNPKNKNNDISAVEIGINKKSMLPEYLVIRDKNDQRTTVDISAMKLGLKLKKDFFICPVQSMKDYEVVDLR